jgi:hypothetical protein
MDFSHSIATRFRHPSSRPRSGHRVHLRSDLGHGRSGLDEGTLQAVIGPAQRRGISRTRFSCE